MSTSLLIQSSTHTSPVLPSGTQPKLFSLPCTINLFLPSLINKSLVSASSIFLQVLTPSTTTYYLKDCPPGSVLLTRHSSGFSPIFLLVLSPSKHLKHNPNHALSPVVFRKVQFSGPYFFILYTTPLSSLIRASSIDRHLYIR